MPLRGHLGQQRLLWGICGAAGGGLMGLLIGNKGGQRIKHCTPSEAPSVPLVCCPFLLLSLVYFLTLFSPPHQLDGMIQYLTWIPLGLLISKDLCHHSGHWLAPRPHREPFHSELTSLELLALTVLPRPCAFPPLCIHVLLHVLACCFPSHYFQPSQKDLLRIIT